MDRAVDGAGDVALVPFRFTAYVEDHDPPVMPDRLQVGEVGDVMGLEVAAGPVLRLAGGGAGEPVAAPASRSTPIRTSSRCASATSSDVVASRVSAVPAGMSQPT